MGGVQLSVKCVCVIVGGVQERVQSLACRRRPGGVCRRRLAITVDKRCSWLQQLPQCMNIHAKIILFHFRRGSLLK